MKKFLCLILAAALITSSPAVSELISKVNIATQSVAESADEILKAKAAEDERLAREALEAERRSNEEMRGVWVATVRNIDYPTSAGTTDSTVLKAQADEIIATCKDLGFNNIFFQVRPTCDAFYKSQIFPWSKYLTGTQGQAPTNDFDPLEYWIGQCHDNGIKLHAWINPYRVTRDNDKADTEWNSLICASNPAKQHPEWLIRHSDNNYYLDPGIPEVRQLVIDGVMEIVNNYDVDGIHFDDYFYPNESQGRINDDNTFAIYGAGYSDRGTFRRDNVNALVSALNPKIKAVKPGVAFGISPTGIWANSSTLSAGSATSGQEHYVVLYADSRNWIKQGWIDYIIPQIYWQVGYDKADYKVLVNWWEKQVEGTDVTLYIGMGDYRTDTKASDKVWYGNSGVDMLKQELELNDTKEAVKGEVHYNYSTIKNNSALSQLYRNYYNR